MNKYTRANWIAGSIVAFIIAFFSAMAFYPILMTGILIGLFAIGTGIGIFILLRAMILNEGI